MSNQKNICCRVFKEQFELIRQLPESEREYVLYQALNNAFNQFENQNDNQIEIQNENAYISVSVSISELGKCILNLLSKNIVCKEFSSNYGGARTGAGRKKGIDNYTNVLDMNTNLVDKNSDDKDMIYIVKDKDKDKDKENNIGSMGEKERKRFIKPTLEEIQAYCKERSNTVNPERFMDYYESNGWRVGKNPMKDWKAAVRTWEKHNPKAPEKPTVNFTELVELWNDMAARLKLQPVSESDLMPERKAEIEKIIATKKPKDLPTLVVQLEQVIKKSPKLLGRQDDIGVDGRWFTRELGWQASFAFCFSTKGWSDIMAGKYNGEMK